ncbi:MAG: ROK family transcriptional regulator [Granulosicoccus sp.]
MRFAPPKRLRIADRASGLNQISVGSYNERLILSLLLQSDGISRMEIGQKTGLSAQTVSVIVRSLEQEGLVSKGQARRGRVGPPTIPLSLNAEGAYSVGVSVGYRCTDIVLIDFVGAVRFKRSLPHDELDQSGIRSQCIETVKAAITSLPVKSQNRIAGIGLALPEDIGTWKLPRGDSSQGIDNLHNELENLLELSVFVQNDITAAASGESMFGVAKSESDYLFFYLGAKLHGRLILNHQIHKGNDSISSAAYDVGILRLEKKLAELAVKYDTDSLWKNTTEWSEIDEEILASWRQECREALKEAVQSLVQFVDVKTIVLSSFCPVSVCESICKGLDNELLGIKALPGELHHAPKAIGAASLPYISRFMVQ